MLPRLNVSQSLLTVSSMHRTNLVVVAMLSMAVPVLSQDQGGTPENQCADRFAASDLNKDNVLTVTELPTAQHLPPLLAKETLISRKQYLAACVKLPLAQGPQFDKPAPPSPHSTGQTVSPENHGKQQPQGQTGPVETKSGGAPAESPQGQTPPGMQAAPGGSTKTIVDPDAAKTAPVVQSPGPGVLPSATPQPSADGIFTNGVLTVAGADPDSQTAPAKFSKRTDAADQLPIAAYTLRHLSPDQRSRIFQALHKAMAISGNTLAIEAVIGAELPSGIALHSLQPLPDELTRDMPELTALAFVHDGNKILLASPTMQRVLAVVEK